MKTKVLREIMIVIILDIYHLWCLFCFSYSMSCDIEPPSESVCKKNGGIIKRMSEESGYSSAGTSHSKSFEQPRLSQFKDSFKDGADSLSLTSVGSSGSDAEETSLSLLNSPESGNRRVRPYCLFTVPMVC